MISLRQHITHGAVSDNSWAGSWWANSPRLNFSARQVSHDPVTSSPASTLFHSSKGHFCSALLWVLFLFHLSFLSVSPYLALTSSSKWAWHASHCLTKVCVCGRCLGRWNLLWDTLISSKPRPRQGGTGQVSGTTRYTPWLILSVRVKSAPSFTA